MSTFGPGNYGGYNDWTFSGSNSFWTNWANQAGTSGLGRLSSVAARWDAYSGFCGGTSGTNDLWNAGSLAVAYRSNGFSVGAVGGGTSQTLHDPGGSTVWQGGTTYYIGFTRTAADCSIFSYADNAGSPVGYSGQSAGDSIINSGTNNWGGGGNGALPAYGTYVPTQIYVWRSGAWQPALVYAWRSGAWQPALVYVLRSGGWNPANKLMRFEEYMQKTERHVPEKGIEVLVDIGDGLERGFAVEEGFGWFGTDPTNMKHDWRIKGHWSADLSEFPYTGRHASWEPEWVVDKRLKEFDKKQRLIKSGDLVGYTKKIYAISKPCGCPNLYDWEREAMYGGK